MRDLNFVGVLTLILSLSLVSFAGSSARDQERPEIPEYDLEAGRAALFSLLENIPLTEIQVNPPAAEGSPQAAFLDFYQSEIVPVYHRLTQIVRNYVIHNQLVSGGYFVDTDERDQWQAIMSEAFAEYSQIITDPEWEAKQLRAAELAEGLPGEFARSVRMNAEQLRFRQHPPEAQALLDESNRLSQQLTNIVNGSEYREAFYESRPRSSRLLSSYFDGELTFEEASQALRDLREELGNPYFLDVYEQGGAIINRIAEIRSELARMKGFDTHADFAVASQAVAHAEGLQSRDEILEFLYDLMEATDEIVDQHYRSRAAVMEKDFEQLRPDQLVLLGQPTYLLVRDYFPLHRLVKIWEESMVESGFPQEDVEAILMDAYPRANKSNGAYMASLQRPTPLVLELDGETMEAAPVPEEMWSEPSTLILQNFSDNGLGHLRTAFHEGGHALDYTYQRDKFGYPVAYGYVETHSTAMEHFLLDREFLLARGETLQGERITEEIVDTFIQRRAISDLLTFRSTVATSIFDIELWDYDYSQGELTFMDRLKSLTQEQERRFSSLVIDEADLPAQAGARMLTGHFTSGSVRYFGYTLASVSAALVAESLLDRLEAETGRRSFYQQPLLADIWIEGLLREGFAVPFPESIESFTGREFSARAYVETLLDALD